MASPHEADARGFDPSRESSRASDPEHSTAAWDGRASEHAPTGLVAGDVLAGRYLIDRFLARGGMGEVYRAVDRELDIPVALKTFRPEIGSDPGALRRLKQEVLVARSISHPNVCRIYDLGRDEERDVSFLTMEYLPGEMLSSRIRSAGPMATEIALPIVRQMTDALDAAHRAGIVHRDFKSANVMLVPARDGERVVVTDFGLAVPLEDSRNGAAPEAGPAAGGASIHTLVGTPAYMSPEQVTGGKLGPAADLYALGVVLFEMTTGRLPFEGSTPLQAAHARLTVDPPAPSRFAPVDAEWDRTILKLLSREPGRRHPSGRDVVLALEGRHLGEARGKYSLPAERDAFVGRVGELALLRTRLESDSQREGGPRLLVVVGAGGTGKTRLARRYGWESLWRWPGGAWFCDLSEARAVDGILGAVATSLDVPLGKDDPVLQLGHAIAGRGRSLVILDNFEQVAPHAPATLGKWLARCTETSFLVTSRERLGLDGEVVVPLEPLDPVKHGVELFELRARTSRPGFRVDEANRGAVLEIVTKLDGLPLAIELAAARLRMLSLDQLRGRLADRFKILSGGPRGRHSTLQATLDWSWELLLPWERSAASQASVFEGGFTLEAAEAVIDLSPHSGAPLLIDVIQSLVDKSWLRAGVALHVPRFEMYGTVQAYAAEKLMAGGTVQETGPFSSQDVEDRHGRIFAEMGTEAAIDALARRGGAEKRAVLERELDNLVSACRRAKAAGRETVAAQTYAAAAEVLAFRGPLALSLALGGETLAILRSPPLCGRVARVLGEAEQFAGRPLEARQHFEQALGVAREAGDRRAEGVVLGNLGILDQIQGRMGEARERFERALALLRDAGDRRLEGVALRNLGLLHQNQGRTEEARAHYEEALATHRQVGDGRSEGIALANLGILHHEHGRMAEARAHFEQALAAFRQVGNRRAEGVVFGNLGNLDREQGRLDEARAHFERALVIHREVGNRRSEGIALGGLGTLHQVQGRLEDARAHYETAVAIHRELGDRRFEGIALSNLGTLCQDQDRLAEARAHLERALAIHREVGDQRFQGVTLANLGVLFEKLGEVEKAGARLDEGIAILREMGDKLGLGKILCQRGEHDLRRGDIDAARAALAEAEAIARSLDLGPDSELRRSLTSLGDALRNERG
jgi:predicted ATPase/Tfp pilus assembly protein PilF